MMAWPFQKKTKPQDVLEMLDQATTATRDSRTAGSITSQRLDQIEREHRELRKQVTPLLDILTSRREPS